MLGEEIRPAQLPFPPEQTNVVKRADFLISDLQLLAGFVEIGLQISILLLSNRQLFGLTAFLGLYFPPSVSFFQ